MKKYLYFLFVLTVLISGCKKDGYEPQKSFNEKYRLSEVVVFSRHNVRAPTVEPGSFIGKITPYTWHDFGVKASELTAKGGALETINGKFFREWLTSEGLFSKTVAPVGSELYFLSNSKQRTIKTAECFLKGFVPEKTVEVHHEGKIDDMDPNFSLALGEDITAAQWAIINEEYESRYDDAGIRRASEALKPEYEKLSAVLDIEDSPAWKDGTFKGFVDYDSKLELIVGKEPALTASIKEAFTVTDALIMQYYEETDPEKEAFGKTLSIEEWRGLAEIMKTYDGVRFCSPFVQHYVSKHQRDLIADALQKGEHKFTYICGHDTNLLNIFNAMHTMSYTVSDAVELRIPIGSKIVFEKWINQDGKAFLRVQHLYQTVNQLRFNIALDLTTFPKIIPLQFEGLQTNEDGLYPFDAMIERLRETVD